MKEFYCPGCKRRAPFDKHCVMMVCRRCGEEMFVIEDKVKSEYKVEVKE